MVWSWDGLGAGTGPLHCERVQVPPMAFAASPSPPQHPLLLVCSPSLADRDRPSALGHTIDLGPGHSTVEGKAVVACVTLSRVISSVEEWGGSLLNGWSFAATGSVSRPSHVGYPQQSPQSTAGRSNRWVGAELVSVRTSTALAPVSKGA